MEKLPIFSYLDRYFVSVFGLWAIILFILVLLKIFGASSLFLEINPLFYLLISLLVPAVPFFLKKVLSIFTRNEYPRKI